MKVEILRCGECSAYTLWASCPRCQQQAVSPKPAKFSIEDKWGKYRRMAKQELRNTAQQSCVGHTHLSPVD